MIRGGFILQPRCIKDSWVAHAAPVVRETWAYLLRRANHKDQKYSGFIVKRGQLFVSYQEIRDALAWYVGARLERYSENQMKHTMKLLRIHSMIELTNQPRGNLITICNYDYYQSPESYESTAESTAESTSDQPRINQSSTAINKNIKNERMKEVNTTTSGGDFFNMLELNALAVKYLNWNPNMNSGRAEQLRPLTAIFKDDVMRGFEIAAANGKESIFYVIATVKSQREELKNGKGSKCHQQNKKSILDLPPAGADYSAGF